MNHAQARNEARQHAATHGVMMIVGLETDDDTGETQIGYCPIDRVGPAFVHTIIECVYPDGTIRHVPDKQSDQRNELENEVIGAAIEFINQARNGLYRSIPKYREALAAAVDALQNECDGEWRPGE